MKDLSYEKSKSVFFFFKEFFFNAKDYFITFCEFGACSDEGPVCRS